jgi:hypothetical protein
MSLTSLLKSKEGSDIRERFRSAFSKPSVGSSVLLIPPVPGNSPIIGAAFDYGVRLMMRKINPMSIERDYWIADRAIDRLPAKQQPRELKIIEDARRRFEQFLKNGTLTDDLLVSMIGLAQLDSAYRSSGQYTDQVGQKPRVEHIADLRALLARLPLEQFHAKKTCLLNPSFGEASRAINGADGDLIIDDVLLDIKTTKNPPLDSGDFQQLMGYYLLYRIGGITGFASFKGAHSISRVGIYFARFDGHSGN